MKICPNCNSQNTDASTFCAQCGFDLTRIVGSEGGTWECPSCKSKNLNNAKFCPNCGMKKPAASSGAASGGAAKTQFFGAMQETNRAKLGLIKGGGFEGARYSLTQEDHPAGRKEGFLLFPDDPFCSPVHANFFYFAEQFFVEDKGSLNGVYIRIKGPTKIRHGAYFRVGEQLFRFECDDALPPVRGLSERGENTMFLGSPIQAGPKPRLIHILSGGKIGGVYFVDKTQITMGREGCTFNYPGDKFISGKHAIFSQKGEDFYLEDAGSKNGTYIRITEPTELKHADYVFIGEQLLRVELV